MTKNIKAQAEWSDIREIEEGEYATGGENGNLNEQAKALAARTEFLKQDISAKADLSYVNTAIGALSTDAGKQYATLALANADITNIPLNKNVFISDAENGGYWYKELANSTTLKKSSFDPVVQGKIYTDEKISELPIKEQNQEDLAVAFIYGEDRKIVGGFKKNGALADPAMEHVKEDIGVDSSKQYADLAVVFRFGDDNSMLFGLKNDGSLVVIQEPKPIEFVAYGDSTTYGADLVNPLTERWTTLLSKQIGKVIENCGISGARAEEIQARFGAINANMSVANSTITASGTVILTAVDINPVRLGGSLQVELLCEDFTKVKGTLARASDTTATFTRSIAGSAITTNRVKVISTSQQDNRSKIMFLGQGINNEGLVSAGTQTLDQIKSWYKSGVTHLSAANPEYVVWGVLDRGVSEAVGTPNGDFIKDLESWLLVEFGSRYAPVRQFLSSQYAIDVAEILEPGFTPTTADTDAIAVCRTPPSFRYTAGSVHLNALGHKLQTWFFKQYLTSRGVI